LESQIPVSIEEYSKDKFITKEHRSFLESEGRVLRPRLARCLDLADIVSGMRVLDVGCGGGELVCGSALRGARVMGIDYADGAIEAAKEAVRLLPSDAQRRIHLQRANAKASPFPNNTFDRILLVDVVEHLYDWELDSIFKELYRVVKEDGYLVIHTLPNKWLLDYGYHFVRLFVRDIPADPRGEYEKIVHVNEMSVWHLSRLLIESGLQARVWLEDTIRVRARWLGKDWSYNPGRYVDGIENVYARLRSPLWQFAHYLVNVIPLRLFFANDILAIAWRQRKPAILRKQPLHLTERLLMGLMRAFVSGSKSHATGG
jgi:2-polyprenyl-3-methyl-5-hydroxy-6-metoxy-1,4-benzoquinol methylase